MNIEDLIESIRQDVRQGAYIDEEILLLCDKTEELIERFRIMLKQMEK